MVMTVLQFVYIISISTVVFTVLFYLGTFDYNNPTACTTNQQKMKIKQERDKLL